MKANVRVNLYWIVAALVSGYLGFLSGRTHGFEFYKLLNLLGLVYSFVAVLIFTYAVLAREPIQDVLAHHMSLAIISFTVLFPVGFSLGSFLGGRTLASGGDLYAFIIISFFPMLYVYTSPVLEPLSYQRFSPEKRIKILGAILLLMGFAFQAVSAFSDAFH